MQIINKTLKLSVMALMGVTSLFAADTTAELERILRSSPEREVELSSVLSEIENPQVEWAVEAAQRAQNQGDIELRNKYLSLGLVLLQRHQMQNFSLSSDSPRAATQTRKFQFQRLYGDEGVYGSSETQSQIESAVQNHLDGESWFLSVLDKLGIMKNDYSAKNQKLRAEYPNLSNAELSDVLIKEAARLTAGVGFATNLPGAIPGVGPAASMALSVGGMVPDMIYLFKQQATLIFRIADLYGKDLNADERVTEALILFGVASGVSSATKALEEYAEKAFTVYLQSQLTEDAVSGAATRLGSMNPILRDIISTLLSKEMLSSAGMEKAANNLIPLVGAGISGAMNYVFTRQVGNVAKAFYGDDTASKLDSIRAMQTPKIELAMLRAVVSVIRADGQVKAEEELALQKIVARFEQHKSTVDAMLAGDESILQRSDYDLAQESDVVKEHVLYAVISMQFVDNDRHPAEIELHDKVLQKFAISQELARRVEARVREERSISSEADAGVLSKIYRQYQKAIGAREEVDF